MALDAMNREQYWEAGRLQLLGTTLKARPGKVEWRRPRGSPKRLSKPSLEPGCGPPVTRRHHSRDHVRYETDLTDAEWALIEPLLPVSSERGRPRTCLHDDQGTDGSARGRHQSESVCVHSSQGGHRTVMCAASPGRSRSGSKTIMNAQGNVEDGIEAIHLIGYVKDALQFTDDGLLD